MIFQWLLDDEMSSQDQLLLSLYDHHVLSPRQFCILSKWKLPRLRTTVSRIRRKAKQEQWIHTIFKPCGMDSTCYVLGIDGLQYCGWMVNERVRRKVVKKITAQYAHTLGLNEILVRLIQAGVDRKQMVFLSTSEASDYLYRLCRMQNANVNKREMIRPDGHVNVMGKSYWLEYDGSTEGPYVIEKKMTRYINTLHPLQKPWVDRRGNLRNDLDKSSVVWVAKTPERSRYLANIWNQFARIRSDGGEGVNMYFFHAGEETPFLLMKR